MSLSFRRRDRDGIVHHYFVPFDPLTVVALFAVTAGVALSAIFTLRNVAYQFPTLATLTIAVALGIGFGLFAVAKLSVIRSGTLVSFGPKLMSANMRRCYLFGYATMSCTCLIFFAIVA